MNNLTQICNNDDGTPYCMDMTTYYYNYSKHHSSHNGLSDLTLGLIISMLLLHLLSFGLICYNSKLNDKISILREEYPDIVNNVEKYDKLKK